MRSKSLKRSVVLAVVGTVMLPFIGGGCLGAAGGQFLREVIVGTGRQVGAATVAPLFTGLIAPAAPATAP